MNKRMKAVATIVALVVAMIPATPARALPDNVVYYTVYSECPPNYGTVIGEWMIDCNGDWWGWGTRPFESCTYYDTWDGDDCQLG